MGDFLTKVLIPKRKCIVFFIIDTSAATAGDTMDGINAAVEGMLAELRDLSAADNTEAEIEVAVLEFSNGARWVTPNGPVNVEDYYWNDLVAGGRADMGAALAELDEALQWSSGFMKKKHIYWAPIILFFSSQCSTDYYEESLIKLWENHIFSHSVKIAFDMDGCADRACTCKVFLSRADFSQDTTVKNC